MENNGRLSNTGDFRTQDADVDALLNQHLGEARTRWGLGDNDPVDIKKIKAGSRVRISVADVGDWVCVRGDDMEGGFTIKVVADAAEQKREEQKDADSAGASD